jgi:hypothetical protein
MLSQASPTCCEEYCYIETRITKIKENNHLIMMITLFCVLFYAFAQFCFVWGKYTWTINIKFLHFWEYLKYRFIRRRDEKSDKLNKNMKYFTSLLLPADCLLFEISEMMNVSRIRNNYKGSVRTICVPDECATWYINGSRHFSTRTLKMALVGPYFERNEAISQGIY